MKRFKHQSSTFVCDFVLPNVIMVMTNEWINENVFIFSGKEESLHSLWYIDLKDKEKETEYANLVRGNNEGITNNK